MARATFTFPSGFLWGAATAAHQVEGNNLNNDWWAWEQQEGHILNGDPLLAPGSDGINGVNLANATLLSSWLGKEVENPVDENVYRAELNKHIAAEGKFPVREG